MLCRAVPLFTLALLACGDAIPLNVGDEARPPVADAVSQPWYAATDTEPLIRRLQKECGKPPGPADYYWSAAELSQRLRGRWYRCASPGSPQAWPFESGVEFQFAAIGVYATLSGPALRACATGDGFVSSTDPYHSGQVLFLREGVSGGEDFVYVDDKKRWSWFAIMLTRADDQGLIVIPTFETSPRRMTLWEVKDQSLLATLVSID